MRSVIEELRRAMANHIQSGELWKIRGTRDPAYKKELRRTMANHIQSSVLRKIQDK
jgi:hypothetical protein